MISGLEHDMTRVEILAFPLLGLSAAHRILFGDRRCWGQRETFRLVDGCSDLRSWSALFSQLL